MKNNNNFYQPYSNDNYNGYGTNENYAGGFPNVSVNDYQDTNLANRTEPAPNNNKPGCLETVTVCYDYDYIYKIEKAIIPLLVVTALSAMPWVYIHSVKCIYITMTLLALTVLTVILRLILKPVLSLFIKQTRFTREASFECFDNKVVLNFTDTDGTKKQYVYNKFTTDKKLSYLKMITTDKHTELKFRTARFEKKTCRTEALYHYLKSNDIYIESPNMDVYHSEAYNIGRTPYMNNLSVGNLGVRLVTGNGDAADNTTLPKCLKTLTVDFGYMEIISRILITTIGISIFAVLIFGFLEMSAPMFISLASLTVEILLLLFRPAINYIMKKSDKNTHFTREVSIECHDGKVTLNFLDDDGFEKGYTYTRFTVHYKFKYLEMHTSDKNINPKFRTAIFSKKKCKIDELYSYLKKNGLSISVYEPSND